jgi:hypothetical protein
MMEVQAFLFLPDDETALPSFLADFAGAKHRPTPIGCARHALVTDHLLTQRALVGDNRLKDKS